MSFDTAPTVREAQEFYAALDAVPPHAVTACVGWTAHEIAAHLAAATAELARIFEAGLAGEPVPPRTRCGCRGNPMSCFAGTMVELVSP
jgi:hypothetical protein